MGGCTLAIGGNFWKREGDGFWDNTDNPRSRSGPEK